MTWNEFEFGKNRSEILDGIASLGYLEFAFPVKANCLKAAVFGILAVNCLTGDDLLLFSIKSYFLWWQTRFCDFFRKTNFQRSHVWSVQAEVLAACPFREIRDAQNDVPRNDIYICTRLCININIIYVFMLAGCLSTNIEYAYFLNADRFCPKSHWKCSQLQACEHLFNCCFRQRVQMLNKTEAR